MNRLSFLRAAGVVIGGITLGKWPTPAEAVEVPDQTWTVSEPETISIVACSAIPTGYLFLLNEEIFQIKADLMPDLNRQIYGDNAHAYVAAKWITK